MTLPRSTRSFHFSTQLALVELTSWRATNLRELLGYLKKAPSSVIYHHTHHFLKQHQFLSPEPPNDFAYWVTGVLQEDRLGEKLAAIDTVQFRSIHALGEKIIAVIEQFLESHGSDRSAPEGEEFHFMKSISFTLPTPYEANDLQEFVACLKKVTPRSIYFHIFDSRLRLERDENDFSNWLKNELDERALAKSITRLDPYTYTSEGLRRRIVDIVEARIKELNEVTHAY